ncbi:MAG: ATP-binding protein [Candidatus Ozemobacteraceae bacterium]
MKRKTKFSHGRSNIFLRSLPAIRRRKTTFSVAHRLIHLEREIINFRKTARKAVAASIAKSEFLSNLSHELRTPLNGVIGMTGMLLDAPLASPQRELVEIVRSSGQTLLSLINNVLDLAKIESGKLELDHRVFSPEETVEDVLEMLSVTSSMKGIEVQSDIDSSVPESVKGDRQRFQQILTNLAGNAIKFTEKGSVTIRLRGLPGDDNIRVRCEVIDTGLGISREERVHLFKPFSQVTPNPGSFGGTGLGLVISRRLAELMGGTIDLESIPGQGSTFWFTACFPILDDREPAPVSLIDRADSMRVMIFSGDSVRRTMLRQKFPNGIFSIEEVADEETAITRLFGAHALGRPFEMLIADVGSENALPKKLSERLCSDGRVKRLPLLLIVPRSPTSALPTFSDPRAQEILLRPIRRLRLLDALRKLTGTNPLSASDDQAQNHASTPSPRPVRSTGNEEHDSKIIHVLVAEDNLVNQKVASRLLEEVGCRVDVVSDGRQALAAMETTTYDTIFLDCRMPNLDGFQTTLEIRNREKGIRKNRIVAMTAFALKGDKERCLAAGMDDYLSKPIMLQELRRVLGPVFSHSQILKTDQDSFHKTASEEASTSSQPVFPQPQQLRPFQTLNRDRLEKLRRRSHFLLSDMASLFTEEAPVILVDMRVALENDNRRELEECSHKLRGSSANLGAELLSNLCEVLENAAPSAPGPDLEALLQEIEREVLHVKSELRDQITTEK